ncbi:MAG: hypothetical protein ACXVCY_18225 [Pseudobdellovibrionaceae bacterium]
MLKTFFVMLIMLKAVSSFASNYECKFDANRSILVTVDNRNKVIQFQDRYNSLLTGQSSLVFNPTVRQSGTMTEVYSGTELLLKISAGASTSEISFFKDLWFVNPAGRTLNCLNN